MVRSAHSLHPHSTQTSKLGQVRGQRGCRYNPAWLAAWQPPRPLLASWVCNPVHVTEQEVSTYPSHLERGNISKATSRYKPQGVASCQPLLLLLLLLLLRAAPPACPPPPHGLLAMFCESLQVRVAGGICGMSAWHSACLAEQHSQRRAPPSGVLPDLPVQALIEALAAGGAAAAGQRRGEAAGWYGCKGNTPYRGGSTQKQLGGTTQQPSVICLPLTPQTEDEPCVNLPLNVPALGAGGSRDAQAL